MLNKTKVIATIGPATVEREQIKRLMENGTDVIRINMSHADYNFCRIVVETVNDLNKELNLCVALLMDLMGPEMRTGCFVNGRANFRRGDKVQIYMDNILGDSTKFSVNYPNLIKQVGYNNIISIKDNELQLEVIDISKDYILCEALTDAIIEDRQKVSVKDVKLKIPYLSHKDETDIAIADKLGFDYISLPYASSPEDILTVNDLLINMKNNHIGLIAKIETEEGIDNIDEIIRVSDGIMIARGDLGVSVSEERIPGIQKKIINKCHAAGIISIVATELLSSMEQVARPTKAEVSDVANAVLDGADAVMLTGETTIGKYPIETLKMMEKIINSAELDVDYADFIDRSSKLINEDITGMISLSVAESAHRLKCCAIIAPTNSGYTARMMSRFRPSCPVIAVSPSIETVKSLQLCFAVTPVLINDLNSFDKIIDVSKKITFKLISTKPGDKIIITGGYPFKDVKYTNFMQIEEL